MPGTVFRTVNTLSCNSYKGGTCIISILQMSKLRQREVKQLVQGHTVGIRARIQMERI